ncbi:DNRLRE domain-containing protein [Paenibacillus gansuensis]|uniref:DNRLRE domain-containing protein n=1 Tax=Paenibacillus gansuensis TaxID=306542 RepID=A0ABW5PG53_9BACL
MSLKVKLLTWFVVILFVNFSLSQFLIPSAYAIRLGQKSKSNEIVGGKKPNKNIIGVEKRTLNSTHYRLSDGSVVAEISSRPQNYLDHNGIWQPIKATLVDEAELGSLAVPVSQLMSKTINELVYKDKENRLDINQTNFRGPQVPFDVILPKKIKKGYSISNGTEYVKFTPLGANNVTASVYKDTVDTIEYQEAWNNTDLQLTLLDMGLKETIILKNEKAPLSYKFQVDGEIEKLQSLEIQSPWLIDANGTKKDVTLKLEKDIGKQYMELIIDPTDLKYPIVVDPTVLTKNPSQDYYCNPSYCDNGSDGNLYLGSNNGSSSDSDEDYFQFDLASIPANSKINNATMGLYIYQGYTDNSISGAAYLVTSPWSQTNKTPTTRPTTDSTNPIIVSTGPYGTVLNSVTRPGWMTVDLSSFVQLWSNGRPNYGVKVTLGAGYQSTKNIYSSEYTDSRYRPYLTVNYESMPQGPVVTSPNGNEKIDTLFNISWNAAIDADTVQSQLKYHVQLSQDGGANWTDIIALTNAGQTQLSYDFSSKANSNNNLIRVRAFDGVQFGPWDQSNSVFTIAHNQAPNIPTYISPGSANPTTPTIISLNPVLNWTFTDPDAGNTQSAYQIQIKNGSTVIHDSGWVTSSANSYTVPGSVLTRGTTYNWTVRTKDNAGAISGFMAPYYFKINNLPAASISSYTDGQQLSDNILTFNWVYSDSNSQTQNKYQILGTQNNWNTIAYNSGILNGNATSLTTSPLASGTWSFKLLVFDGLEWSNAAFRNNLTLPNAFEPNDTNAQAFPINYNQTYTSLINSSSDVDFFKFTPTASEINRLTLNVPSGLNYDLYIYNSSMQLITAGVQGTAITENQLFDVTSGNTYYIKIVGVGGNNSITSTYSFTLTPISAQYQTTYQYDSNGNITNKTTVVIR